eukprot:7737702-Alexandrium_andersonii.AAC.1
MRQAPARVPGLGAPIETCERYGQKTVAAPTGAPLQQEALASPRGVKTSDAGAGARGGSSRC